MCGIAGIVDLKNRPVERGLVERLCDRLSHRGPDDEGYYLNGNVALGQRRLSIIDLSTGKQPMANEDETVWVTFNGEIYNFQELRDELIRKGHRFATQSDTEVIVHGYEEYGAECVSRFRGMFAFALWDANEQTILLARDRVGKKPLFYTEVDGQLIFASELQAVLAHPGVRREIDLAAIDRYLTYGYIPAPATAFQGVFKLPPGHYLKVTNRGSGIGNQGSVLPHPSSLIPNPSCYWQLDYGPKLGLDEDEAVDELLRVLTEAVRLRLIADVPLGALLSGGVDSSLVVALMSRLSDRPVQTFSVGFEEQGYNELPYARLVAQQYGTDHHELVVRPRALDVLPTLVRHYGEPYADSSAIPTYYVAKLTRQHVTVALNGDGGDECLAGYERYLGSLMADAYQRIPRFVRRGVLQPLSALVPDSLPRRNRLRQAKRFIRAAGQPFGPRYLRWVSYFTPAQKTSLYTTDFTESLNGADAPAWLLSRLEEFSRNGHDHLDALLAADVQSYLAYDLLVKMDIATMANSLEARSPFLDHKVMEFCARLPSRYKIRGRTLKYLLKKAGARLLPKENLKRRKMGFGVPVGEWMRHELRPLVQETLLSPQARTRTILQRETVRRMVIEHSGGGQDHTDQLWSLLWLELWWREFLD